MSKTLPVLLADFYKTSHRVQYPTNTSFIFSNWIPRTSRDSKITQVVSFGYQRFVKEILIDYFNQNFFSRDKAEVLREYKRFITYTLGPQFADSKHIEELHDHGKLPVRIQALPEGTKVPIGVPMMTVVNLLPQFFWVTNFLETLISCEIWQPATGATIANEYRKLLESWALKTTGSIDGVEFQGHDFSMRGMAGWEQASKVGAGHLTSFVGTDTMPAICALEEYYGANIETELVGCSIPATEHSVQCVNGVKSIEEETEFAKRLVTEIYPTGLVSMVSDTINLWDVIGKVLPAIKDEVLARDGKLVIRPDSGDPVEILCGTNSEILHINNADELNDFILDCDWNSVFKYEGKYWRLDASDKQSFIEEYGRDQFAQSVSSDLAEIEYKCGYIYEIEQTDSPAAKGVIELLWDLFGGTVNAQGYKVLDSHIGCIYGDSITLDRAQEICKRLEAKGFASTNIVLGIGSYTYQYNTRDTFGFAMKTTWATVDGKEHQVYKNPVTDDGTKKSLKGLCVVVKDTKNNFMVIDKLSLREYESWASKDQMVTIFDSGEAKNLTTLKEIRERVRT